MNEEIKKVVVIMGDPTKQDPIKPDNIFDEDDKETVDKLKYALKELDGYNFIYLNNHNVLFNRLKRLRKSIDIHLVLNLCDEGFNNDPTKEIDIPVMLERLNLPYTGASSTCLASCYDKSIVKSIAIEMGIPVAEGFLIDSKEIEMPNIQFPLIAKPNFGDGGFGVTKDSIVYSLEGLYSAISKMREEFNYHKSVIVERFIDGKDLSIGIIGNFKNYRILPITEEDYSALPPDFPKICGYETKWLPDSPYQNIKTIPVELSEITRKIIVNSSLNLFERLECRDYVRFDWRLNKQGNPYLLEVNPNPGWCWDGHLAKMSAFAGISYSKMLGLILMAAEQRYELHSNDKKEPVLLVASASQ